MLRRTVLRAWYKLIRKSPDKMPMVQYWKHGESVAAKITKSKHGNIIMKFEGEDELFPSFPRGHLLFGPLSKLKHEIKNQIFNESWAQLEYGKDPEEVVKSIKQKLFGPIQDLAETLKYEMLPPQSMAPSVKEIHRAWTIVAPRSTWKLRDYLCCILQEDDSYRFRMQWIVTWFGWFFKRNPVPQFQYALEMLEHAEVISDMKERQRLLRRILMAALQDPTIKDLFEKLCKEIDWNKVKLTKADKYHFRGKYFKVDYDVLEY